MSSDFGKNKALFIDLSDNNKKRKISDNEFYNSEDEKQKKQRFGVKEENEFYLIKYKKAIVDQNEKKKTNDKESKEEHKEEHEEENLDFDDILEGDIVENPSNDLKKKKKVPKKIQKQRKAKFTISRLRKYLDMIAKKDYNKLLFNLFKTRKNNFSFTSKYVPEFENFFSEKTESFVLRVMKMEKYGYWLWMHPFIISFVEYYCIYLITTGNFSLFKKIVEFGKIKINKSKMVLSNYHFFQIICEYENCNQCKIKKLNLLKTYKNKVYEKTEINDHENIITQCSFLKEQPIIAEFKQLFEEKEKITHGRYTFEKILEMYQAEFAPFLELINKYKKNLEKVLEARNIMMWKYDFYMKHTREQTNKMYQSSIRFGNTFLTVLIVEKYSNVINHNANEIIEILIEKNCIETLRYLILEKNIIVSKKHKFFDVAYSHNRFQIFKFFLSVKRIVDYYDFECDRSMYGRETRSITYKFLIDRKKYNFVAAMIDANIPLEVKEFEKLVLSSTDELKYTCYRMINTNEEFKKKFKDYFCQVNDLSISRGKAFFQNPDNLFRSKPIIHSNDRYGFSIDFLQSDFFAETNFNIAFDNGKVIQFYNEKLQAAQNFMKMEIERDCSNIDKIYNVEEVRKGLTNTLFVSEVEKEFARKLKMAEEQKQSMSKMVTAMYKPFLDDCTKKLEIFLQWFLFPFVHMDDGEGSFIPDSTVCRIVSQYPFIRPISNDLILSALQNIKTHFYDELKRIKEEKIIAINQEKYKNEKNIKQKQQNDDSNELFSEFMETDSNPTTKLVYKSSATKTQQIPSIYNANNLQQNPTSITPSISFIPLDISHLQYQIQQPHQLQLQQQQMLQFSQVDIEIPTNILHSENDLNLVQNTFNINDINNTNNNTTNTNNNNTDEDWEIFFNS